MMNETSGATDRKVLVCLLGLYPQLLTETLYALATAEESWVPSEIHVITTSAGADALRRLFTRGSPYEELLDEFLPRRRIAFAPDKRHVHVIERDGHPLDDIRVPEDSTAAADAILDVILPLVRDERCEIHASIAGGRKTMGPLLVNLMSLLGRPRDRVSHVLISDSRFESHAEFFFPSQRNPRQLRFRDGSTAMSNEPKVTLGMVPILRFSAELPKLLSEKGLSYEALFLAAEATLLPKPVLVSPAARRISVGGLHVELEPAMMARYLFLAERRMNRVCEPGLIAPGLVRVNKDPSKNIGISDEALQRSFDRLGLTEPDMVSPRVGEFKDLWTQGISYLNAAFREALPADVAQSLVVVGPGDRKKRDGQYGLLNLDPARIRIG